MRTKAEFYIGIGYPDAPTPEDVVRSLREQGVELPPLPPRVLEAEVVEAIEDAINRFCKPMKFIELETPGSNYREGTFIYACEHPNIGRFYIYMEEREKESEKFGGVKFTTDESEAIARFAEQLERYLEEHDAMTLSDLEEEMKRRGLEVKYSI